MSYAPLPPPPPDQVAAWVATQPTANQAQIPGKHSDIEPWPVAPTVATEEPTSHIESLATRITEDGQTFILRGERASSITPRPLDWLWDERIPAGKITLGTGKPDTGKSLAVLDIIGTVTTGRDWPDGKNTMGPREVLLAAAEDDAEDTIIPRLMAAGADLTKVFIVRCTFQVGAMNGDKATGTSRALSLERDKMLLATMIKEHPDLALICFDPLISYLGNADANKDSDIRPIMDGLKNICDKTGITILALIHSNKKTDLSAVHRVSGAGSLAAAARSVWAFCRDQEQPNIYRMARVKGNLSKNRTGLTYSIETTPIEIEGKSVGMPHIVWGAAFDGDADDMIAMEKDATSKKDFKSDKAMALLSVLTLPMMATDIYREAEKQGISSDSMKRAKSRVGNIDARRLGEHWWWFPKTDPKKEAEQKRVINDTSDLDFKELPA
jgi:putative DNA primase/helicase